MVFFIYFLIIFHSILLLNTVVNLYLVEVFDIDEPDSSEMDSISILIPARNEEENLKLLLEQFVTQSDKNFELIVLDDHSTDKTYELASKYKQFAVMKAESLPEGWLGKNWACQQLAKESSGKFITFVDADVRVGVEFVKILKHHIAKSHFDFASIFPKQANVTLGEKIGVPLLDWVFITFHPGFLKRFIKHRSLGAANGQVLIFKRDTYFEIGANDAVKEQLDDIGFSRIMAESSYDSKLYRSKGAVQVRMYKNLREVINGFARSLVLALGKNTNNILAGFGNLILLIYIISLVIAAFYFSNLTILLILIIALQFIAFSAMHGLEPLTFLLHIPRIFFFGYICNRTIYLNVKNKLEWKGRPIHMKST